MRRKSLHNLPTITNHIQMPLFQKKPKGLKGLQLQILTSQTLFGMYNKLPTDKQLLAMQNDPPALANAVRSAVAEGHAGEARELLTKAAGKVPAGVTAEQWTKILAFGFDALP